MLSILVGANSREFQVPRGLICPHSQYFRKAFNKRWAEGRTGPLDLEDVEEWIFECFVNWLYNNRLTFGPAKSNNQATHDHHGVATHLEDVDVIGSADAVTAKDLEPDPSNAVTWKWRDLIALYIFADKYDTKGLRQMVMETIQVKFGQTKPVSYSEPSFQVMSYAFHNLPDTSPLYDFMLQLLAYEKLAPPLTSASRLEVLPLSVLAMVMTRLMQLRRWDGCDCKETSRDCEELGQLGHSDIKDQTEVEFCRRIGDLCKYHEHETAEGKKLCRAKWIHLNEKHGLDLEDECEDEMPFK